MASAQVVETSVTKNSPSQDSYHPDDLFQSRYATPGFKPFSYLVVVVVVIIVVILNFYHNADELTSLLSENSLCQKRV